MSNELFEKAPIRTAYLKLAIPVVLSMVVQLVYSMVDTYIIYNCIKNPVLMAVYNQKLVVSRLFLGYNHKILYL